MISQKFIFVNTFFQKKQKILCKKQDVNYSKKAENNISVVNNLENTRKNNDEKEIFFQKTIDKAGKRWYNMPCSEYCGVAKR